MIQKKTTYDYLLVLN